MFLMSGRGDDLADRVLQSCKHLEHEKGMTIFVKPVETGFSPGAAPSGRVLQLRTLGADKAGIVAKTARAVADAGGNIRQLSSRLHPAAGSGTPLYEMEMSFELPDSADIAALRARLDLIQDELHVDISVRTS